MHWKISILQNYAKTRILSLKLSPISLLLFIFLISCNFSSFAEENSEISTDCEFKFRLKVLSSINIPLSSTSRLWSPFPTGGVKVSLPVGVKNTEIHGVAEYGVIKGYENEELEIKTGLIRLLVSYSFHLKNEKFTLKPFLGIMDMMIHHNEEDIFESVLDTELFKNVENEFGISIGIEPEFSLKRFSVSLPIFYDLLFSSPKVYQSFNTSLAIGMTF